MLPELLVSLHATVGPWGFLACIAAITVGICAFAIPRTTDMMVNASAGLAGKYLGPKTRTLVINASTNNPELFSMIVSLVLLRVGGIANPLGSNLANIYLMFLIAPGFVLLRFAMTGRSEEGRGLLRALWTEKRLVSWHIIGAVAMFATSTWAYSALTGQPVIGGGDAPLEPPAVAALVPTLLICIGAVGGFMFLYGRLQRRRPELFTDIDDDAHTDSWLTFFLGTGGLILACYVMNAVFLACSEIYQGDLQKVLGTAIFAGLHYFVGALVTSLPEMKVAIDNYTRRTAPDINTAMASASVSNMTNMAIAAVGTMIILVLTLLGFTMQQ